MNDRPRCDRSIDSPDPGRTRLLGRSLAQVAGAGTLLLLNGELGSGKTVLVKGLAAGLGSEGPVTSPTFVLCSHYRGGRLPLVHMDLFRIPEADIEDAGLDEPLAAPAVVAVEWPSESLNGLLGGLGGPAILEVHIAVTGPNHRRIGLRARSDPARALLARLGKDPW
ncbi:MAG: tRNA (adenosine(37)-N6)-threonylcarbamoyltransferase complex ATPase subunit type 1 TsaE [Chloroflexi bacterium]|nr:tRNA (adenosine(37)-N6)-threonylcarbamoyltransferase complex ATPase subunit type 1 TsaE [Chloroflexota bacterium]MYC47768.1 tRNA (adenosine(37)-N6)-threonylcarbamoyltransferase complex ATPase subunit type 1 TsaE [Chloroflexota bacterium]